MSGIFDKYYKRYDSWYDRNKFAYSGELEAVKKFLPQRGKGLEIGVGTGRFAVPLGIATGVDPSKKMLEIAKKRGINTILGYGEKLPFRDSTFDYVAIIITLCFVKDPPEVLREAGRVLKKNGKLILGIIDKDSFLGKYYQKKKSIFYKEANLFGIKEVINLLKSAGFKYFSCYQTIFHLPKEMDFIEPPQEGFGRGGFVVIKGEKSILTS